MNSTNVGPRFLEILRVEMCKVDDKFLYRIISSGWAYHGFELIQATLDARYLLKTKKKERP